MLLENQEHRARMHQSGFLSSQEEVLYFPSKNVNSANWELGFARWSKFFPSSSSKKVAIFHVQPVYIGITLPNVLCNDNLLCNTITSSFRRSHDQHRHSSHHRHHHRHSSKHSKREKQYEQRSSISKCQEWSDDLDLETSFINRGLDEEMSQDRSSSRKL